MSPERYKLLVEDIAAYGVIHPITLHHGQVLDGRHRLRACEELGLEEPEYVTDDELLEHNGDAWAFVRSQLIVKDHTTGQLSMFAADHRKAMGLDAKAHERKRQAKGRGVKKEKHSATGHEVNGRSSDEAAAAFGVSGRSVDRAQRVIDHGCKQLQQAVRDGRLEVTIAEQVAKSFQGEEQEEIVAAAMASDNPKKSLKERLPKQESKTKPAPSKKRRGMTVTKTGQKAARLALEQLGRTLDAIGLRDELEHELTRVQQTIEGAL